jgi:hypothetical protein
MTLGKAGRRGGRHGHSGGDSLLHYARALVVHAGDGDCGWGAVAGTSTDGSSGSSGSSSIGRYCVDDGGRSFECGRGAGG